MRKSGSTILLVLILIAGVALIAYPSIANYWNSFHQSRAITSYSESVAQIDASVYDEIWNAADEYNTYLETKRNRFFMQEEEAEWYNNLLNVAGIGVIGYIEIEKLGVYLPIYHTTSEPVLQVAIGHIEGSSLPTGKVGTHVALSGHRGLPSATLFTNLDKLQETDTFTLNVLNRMFTFEVDQIRIVLPNELQDLNLDPEQTYCTLVTCTPYGINTHRLLVRGHLIDNPEDEVEIRIVADANQIEPLLVAPVVAAPILLLLLIILLISTSGRKNKRKER